MVHGVLLFSMLLYVFMGEIAIQHEPRDLSRILPIIFGVVSLQIIGMTIYFRRTKVQKASETLQSKPDDAKALQQWRFGGILTAVLMEVIVLYGFALRFLGAPRAQAVPFYVAGIGLMLLWWPQRP
jgi:hypothetical protein